MGDVSDLPGTHRFLDKLESVCQETNLTRDELARLVGIDVSALNRLFSREAVPDDRLTIAILRAAMKAGAKPKFMTLGAMAVEMYSEQKGAGSSALPRITIEDNLAPISVVEQTEDPGQTVPAETSRPTPALPYGSAAQATFISYRRTDEPSFAGRLYDKLETKFGKNRVFMDVDSIELGVDFVDELGKALSQCAVLIVIIGPRWLTASDPFGQRRLNDPDDFVRLEVEHALESNIRVIPVLVDGTPMPRRQDLPESLAPLVRRNGHTMTHARFGSDCIELISTLERILSG